MVRHNPHTGKHGHTHLKSSHKLHSVVFKIYPYLSIHMWPHHLSSLCECGKYANIFIIYNCKPQIIKYIVQIKKKTTDFKFYQLIKFLKS